MRSLQVTLSSYLAMPEPIVIVAPVENPIAVVSSEAKPIGILAVTTRPEVLVTAMEIESLNNAFLKQGDRIDYFKVIFNNRSKLEDGHPLKTNGFLTVGYTMRFVAKPDLRLADDGVGVISTVLTPDDADNAPLLLLPSATSGIVFGDRSSLDYHWDVQISDGADHVYTLATGSFTLLRDVAINP